MTELNRLIRHAVAPLTAWFVAKGYLPVEMQGDVTEFIIMLLAYLVPLAVSKLRDIK